MTRFSDASIDELKARHPVDAVAGQWVTLRARRGRSGRGFTHAGPCPFCSSGKKKSDARFECSAEKWACAACGKGGDVIALWALRHGLDAKRDFKQIVEQLGGVAEVQETAATAKRSGRCAYETAKPRSPVPERFRVDRDLCEAWIEGWVAAENQAQANAAYRERERKRLHDQFWAKAAAWQGTPVERYLRLRGLMVPPSAKLRYFADMPYFKSGDEREPEILHRGPAMLAAIRDAQGIFRGLHITWLDPLVLLDADQQEWEIMCGNGWPAARARKFKADIFDPETRQFLKAKKSRGTKQGGYIDLGGHPLAAACRDPSSSAVRDGSPAYDRQFSGEGIESTLAVYTAMVMADRDVTGIAWRCGIDLGNLCGAAAATVRHPELKDAAGRSRRVPGPEPDLASPAMPLIPSCRDYVQIGDGDSDAFTTRAAMARGEARRKAESVQARTIWPPDGMDFNDWIMRASVTGKTTEDAAA